MATFKTFEEIQAWQKARELYRALDRNYINREEFDTLYSKAREIIVILQKLIDYLKTSELTGVKFKKVGSNAN